jgi:hypothetical protein
VLTICSVRQDYEASPFLRIPGELRNRIYDYLFSGVKIRPVRKATDLINIFFVCRQLYAETALLPYRESTFAFQAVRTPIRFRKGKAVVSEFLAKRTYAQLLAMQHFEIWVWNLGTLVILGEPSCQIRPEYWDFIDQVPNLKRLTLLRVHPDNSQLNAPECELWEEWIKKKSSLHVEWLSVDHQASI